MCFCGGFGALDFVCFSWVLWFWGVSVVLLGILAFLAEIGLLARDLGVGFVLVIRVLSGFGFGVGAFSIGLGTFGWMGLFGYVLVISVCFVVEFVLGLLNCECAGFSCVYAVLD